MSTEDFLAILHTARNFLYKKKLPEEAYNTLFPLLETAHLRPPHEFRMVGELAAAALFQQKRYFDACNIYLNMKDFFGIGYCQLMMGDLITTQQAWSTLQSHRPNHWAITLFGLVTRQLLQFPTFLQIRNHLESDVANLAAANQFILLSNLLLYADSLSHVNVETYKLLGRSLLHAGLTDQAGPYLIKAQKACPQDPEIYYHLGQYTSTIGEYKSARIILHQCLMMNPLYVPAKELLESLPA